MSDMFWLSAFLRPLLLPPLNLLLLMAAGFLLVRAMPKAGRVIMVTSFVLLTLLSTSFGANLLVLPLEKMTSPLSANDRKQGQAIVVLAAGKLRNAPEYENTDIPDYVALARLRYAARLQHQTGLPILVTGGNVPFVTQEDSLAQAMAVALREDFLAPVRWIESQSKTTEQNARFSAAILEKEKIDHILLVTDAMHMPRASMAFRHTGLQVIEAPTMFFGHFSFEPHYFIPDAESLRRSAYAMYEWIGLLWYRYWLDRPAYPQRQRTAP